MEWLLTVTPEGGWFFLTRAGKENAKAQRALRFRHGTRCDPFASVTPFAFSLL
jgi:hypothetical protein